MPWSPPTSVGVDGLINAPGGGVTAAGSKLPPVAGGTPGGVCDVAPEEDMPVATIEVTLDRRCSHSCGGLRISGVLVIRKHLQLGLEIEAAALVLQRNGQDAGPARCARRRRTHDGDRVTHGEIQVRPG